MKRPLYQMLTALILSGFLLGVRNGQVAIWKDNDPQPIRVFNWSVSLLPSPIQEALIKGIRIDSDSDIGQLIQDMIA